MNVAKLPSQIFIGYEADNAWTPVVIDWTEWAEKEPGGVLTVLLQRNGDANPYPVVLTTDGTVSTWKPSSTDTAVPGFGRLQLKYTVGDVVGHSKVLNVNIGRSLEPATDPPDPYESWLDTLTELAAETEQYANSAQQSAEDAEDAQTAAETAEQSAEGYAASAEEAATAASASAAAAVVSETNAALFESNAQGYATRAETAQTRAESAQTASESARDTAVASATSAGQSATLASASASSAESSANSAASSATSASASATLAGESATSASGSASSASASASSATQSATQASQSASSASQSATSASGSAGDASISATSAETYSSLALQASGNASASATSAEASAESAAQSASEALETLLDTAPVITDTASGAIASFSDGASNRPVVGLNVAIEPVQDLHGQSSPYPAGGGVNKVNPSDLTPGWIYGDDGTVYPQDSTKLEYTSDFIEIPSGTTYVTFGYDKYGADISNRWVAVGLYDENKDFLVRQIGTWVSSTSGLATYDISSYTTAKYARFCARTYGHGTEYLYGAFGQHSAFSPYQNICPITGHTQAVVTRTDGNGGHATTITIPFGDTIYGGTVDVVEGKLNVTMAMVDLGTLSWTYNTTYAFFLTQSLIDRKIGVTNMVSDLFKTEAGSWSGTPKTNAIWGNGSNASVYVQYPLTAVEDFLALVTGHQLVYELATPITIDLTPQQLTTLLGDNCVWADTGDTTVEYRADTKKYIQKMIAEAVA